MKTLPILLLLLATSCSIFSPENKAMRKLRKAEKLIKQAEQLGSKWSQDTVYKEIPFIVDSVRVDSVFVAKQGDTVVIEKERLKLRYVKLPGDSVFIEAECKADTVYKSVPVSVTKTIEAKINWWLYFGIGFGACLLLVIVVGRLRN